MKTLWISFKVLIFFSLVLGLGYPFFITAVSYSSMRDKAEGSLVFRDGKPVGSSLIGQKFTARKYFFSRPSAADYNASASAASNLGPTSKALMDQVDARIKQARGDNGIADSAAIPADMALASASGLDPHISADNAFLQAKRVASARGMDESDVRNLIRENTNPDFVGVWGRPGVNVLELNMALDANRKE
jgi:K+-transporting ATPase ATPase C chain